jgi:hypothetical protein
MRALQVVSFYDVDVLLTWFAVLRACAFALAVEALGLGLLSFVRPPRGVLRIGAVASLAAAIGAGVRARNAFATYQQLNPADYLGIPATSQWQDRQLQRIAQAVAFYDAVGWSTVVVTAVLLVAGLGLTVIVLRSKATPRHATARPSQGTAHQPV